MTTPPKTRLETRRYSLFAKPLKGCVEGLVRPIFKAQGVAASKLVLEWVQIVGKEMATHTAVIKLTFPKNKNNEGTLTIACDGAHALTLQHMQPVIIERIASYFGYRAVAHITIIQQQISAAANEKSAKKKTRKTINTDCLNDLEDDELRTAFSSLAKTLAGDDNGKRTT